MKKMFLIPCFLLMALPVFAADEIDPLPHTSACDPNHGSTVTPSNLYYQCVGVDHTKVTFNMRIECKILPHGHGHNRRLGGAVATYSDGERSYRGRVSGHDFHSNTSALGCLHPSGLTSEKFCVEFFSKPYGGPHAPWPEHLNGMRVSCKQSYPGEEGLSEEVVKK